MTEARFRADINGIATLLNDPKSLALLDTTTERVASAAASITRRGARNPHIADQYVTEKAKPTADGGQAKLANTSSFFHLEQFGSQSQPPQRMVDKAFQQAGVPYKPLPK